MAKTLSTKKTMNITKRYGKMPSKNEIEIEILHIESQIDYIKKSNQKLQSKKRSLAYFGKKLKQKKQELAEA